jgi:uroporphyrin-III C-methyltransferase
MKTKGSICLVEGGPGDPELLTLKGLKAIQSAEVILYDALINPILLNYNPKAVKIYVGKRPGLANKTQVEINQLLIDHALKGKRVIRLKGGDPLIFGRAAEELAFANLFGIPTQVIPGISSYTGIAAAHQIPLTKRNVSESLWITTGHTKRGVISSDIAMAAKTNATIIVLMGMRFLEEIVEVFSTYKALDHPIAIIQNGTTASEKVVLGSLENILAQVKQFKISNPANIILGEGVVDQITQYKNLKTPLWIQ